MKWTLKNIPEALSSPVVVGDYLYPNAQSRRAEVRRMKTGKVVYTERIQGVSTAASPIAASDRIYLVSAGKIDGDRAGTEVRDPRDQRPRRSEFRLWCRERQVLILKGGMFVYCVGKK